MPYHGIIFTDSLWSPRTRPYGAYSIANTLRELGYKILVIDYLSSLGLSNILSLLDKFITNDTVFVGYGSSLFMSTKLQSSLKFLPINVEDFVAINTKIKLKNPNTRTIFGGSLSHSLYQYNLQNNNNLGIDYVVEGYADSMMPDLMHAFCSGKKVIGSSFHNKQHLIAYDTKAERFNFRDSIHKWCKEDFVAKGEALPIETARGCVFKCKFCAFTMLGKNKNDNTYLKSEDSLYAELKRNYDLFGTTTYTVVDDTFNERTDKIENLLRARDRLGVELDFVGYNRLDMIARKPEQLDLLKNLGFKGFFFGIESLNWASAKSVGKGMHPDETVDMLYKINEVYNNNVSITGSFILGLPYETRETASKWLTQIADNSFPISFILLSRLHFTNFSNSKSIFHENYKEYGYEMLGDNKWKNSEWNSDDLQKTVNRINIELVNTGRQKLSVFSLPSFVSMNKSFNSLIHTPIKNISEFEVRDFHKKRVAEYIQLLYTL